MSNRAIFIDRDGTFNVVGDYIHKIEDFKLIPGSDEAVRLAHGAGFLVIMVTNQAGVGRGYYTEEDVKAFHRHIQGFLGEKGERIDAFYYCPYHPTKGVGEYLKDADCRKPKPGMLLEGAKDLDIDLSKSYMVGDTLGDIQAGNAAGCETIMVLTGYGKKEEGGLTDLDTQPIAICENLLEAVRTILEIEGSG